MSETVRTADVFGIQRDVPLNYVTRPSVDDEFVDSLSRDKHVVVYGSSKQGKTSLRKYNLQPADYITVVCGNSLNLAQLHSVILKAAGYTIEQSSTRTLTGESKINAKVSAGIGIGPFRVGSDVEAGDTKGETVESTEVGLELDPEDVNDIIRALQEIAFEKYIVLEDFHYLPIETQEAFSIALKAFHEQSRFVFIIVGVWLDENRLVQFNGDLTGRVLAIDADAWSQGELNEVIDRGQDLLNVKINEAARGELVSKCFDSVYIVQEACYRLCTRAGVFERQGAPKEVGAGVDVEALIREIVNEQVARYGAFLSGFAGGFQETELEMYKWILLPLLMASAKELEGGLPWNLMRKVIDANHPKAPVNPGNLTQALGSVASLQVRKKITPIVVDYDQTEKELNVVDRGFLIWVSYQDRAQVRADQGLPEKPNVPATVSLGELGQQTIGGAGS